MKRRSQAALPANRCHIHFLHKRLSNFHGHVPTKVHHYRSGMGFSDSQSEPPLCYIILPFSLSTSNPRALLWVPSLPFFLSKIKGTSYAYCIFRYYIHSDCLDIHLTRNPAPCIQKHFIFARDEWRRHKSWKVALILHCLVLVQNSKIIKKCIHQFS